MPVFRKDYTKDVDLGGLGRFVLRELEAGEQREYNVTIAERQLSIGIEPDMTREQRQQVMRAMSAEERLDYQDEGRKLEAGLLAKVIVSWDGDVEVNTQTVSELPTITRMKLGIESQEMNTAEGELRAFLERSSEPLLPISPLAEDLPETPRPPMPSNGITSAGRWGGPTPSSTSKAPETSA